MIDYSLLTPNQIKAINTDGTNILVSAGAGSGKTKVLSYRVLRKLEDGIPINRLVILTFTNLAANEMRQRIKDSIKLNQALDQQLQLLDNAMISTFDAFALRMVKEYHYLLHLPKTISIADNIILDKLRKSALEATLKEFYLLGDERFARTIERLFDRSDDAFCQAVETLAKGLETLPERKAFQDNYAKEFFSPERLNDYAHEFSDLIFNMIQAIKPEFDELSTKHHGESNPRINDYMEKMRSFYHDLFAVDNLESITDFFRRHKHPSTISKAKDIDEDALEDIKSRHSSLRNRIKPIADIFDKLSIDGTEDIFNDIEETKETVLAVMEVTKTFLNRYEILKKEKHLFHFSDIMKYAIELFSEHEDIREQFRNDIDEIMVDEYQDTNDLQEYLLELLGDNNLFMVGDIKQSIYGFRNANPKNFLRKYQDYSQSKGGIVIDLLENFRSRKEVLHFVNFVFQTMMDESIGGIDYQDNQALKCGLKVYDELRSPDMEYDPDILVYDPEEIPESMQTFSKAEIEAIAIRNDIAGKMKQKMLIFDPVSSKLRHVEYKDFAILADRKTSFETIQKILVSASIPVDIFTEEIFSMSEEIQFVWQFVRIVNCLIDPLMIPEHFSSAFMGVCRSFVYQKSDDLLVELFIGRKFKVPADILELKSMPEYAAIINTAEEASRIVLQKPLHDAIERIYEITDLFFHLTKLVNPSAREAKLDFLYQKTVEFSGLDFQGFIDYLTTVYQNDEIDIEYRNSHHVIENTVKILSMHKAKGLEYPIVYYYGLDKKFNYTENKNLFVFDQVYGLVTKSFKNGFKNTILHTLMERKNYQEYVSERIRLFYVALTRAREKQILLFDTSSLKDEKIVLCKSGYLDLDIRRKFNKYSDLFSHLRLPNQWVLNADLSNQKAKTKRLDTVESASALTFKSFVFETGITRHETYHKTELRLLSAKEKQSLEFGRKIHETMEFIDFKHLQASLDSLDRQLAGKIRALVATKPFHDLENAYIYQEYPFFYKDGLTEKTGIIDLMIDSKDLITLIDYKLKDLSADAYVKQLAGYRQYIESLTAKPVESYLYSFSDELLVKIGD